MRPPYQRREHEFVTPHRCLYICTHTHTHTHTHTQATGLTCEHEFVTPHRPTFYNITSTTPATFQTPASLAMRFYPRPYRPPAYTHTFYNNHTHILQQ